MANFIYVIMLIVYIIVVYFIKERILPIRRRYKELN
jgi:hypothetical protein